MKHFCNVLQNCFTKSDSRNVNEYSINHSARLFVGVLSTTLKPIQLDDMAILSCFFAMDNFIIVHDTLLETKPNVRVTQIPNASKAIVVCYFCSFEHQNKSVPLTSSENKNTFAGYSFPNKRSKEFSENKKNLKEVILAVTHTKLICFRLSLGAPFTLISHLVPINFVLS